jgi:hypothetical protein
MGWALGIPASFCQVSLLLFVYIVFVWAVDLTDTEALEICRDETGVLLPVQVSKAGLEERWLDIQMQFVSFAAVRGKSFS